MAAVLVCLAALSLAALAWWAPGRWREHRRQRLRRQPLPATAVAVLERDVPLYRRLPPALRRELHGHINVFLAEKRFEGCAGCVVTETMRLVIAAQACVLLLGRPPRYFPGFSTILVYPDTFLVPQVEHDGDVEIHDEEARLGESWEHGPVVLSWADIAAESAHEAPGCNVVLHEFAHKLDEEDARMDGLPLLDDAAHYARWAEVMTREYARLQQAAERDDDSGPVDLYGAHSPPEFFAVVTEAFFECAAALRHEHPELYGELAAYYRLDPASWI